MMLCNVKALLGYAVRATDSGTGKVHDFYFDNETWAIRYLVVDIGDWVLDTGDWIPGRKVVVPSDLLGQPYQEAQIFPVRLTKEQVEHSCEADIELPNLTERKVTSPEHTSQFGIGLLGAEMNSIPPPSLMGILEGKPLAPEQYQSGSYLWSIKEIPGYYIQANDGEIGHVEDFIIDTGTWSIRFMLIDTQNWLPGKKVVVAPQWITMVNRAESKVYVNLLRGTIKNSPELDLLVSLNQELI